MVQLKDCIALRQLCTPQISIPYGSIKRVEAHPYVVCTSRFQFLMVQLKASSSRNTKELTNISIPYGSIKSIIGAILSLFTNWISIPYGSIKSP